MKSLKQCSTCKRWKKLNEFYEDNRKDDKRSKDGLYSCCKSCQLIKSKKWRKENPQKMYLAKKKWTEKNRLRVNRVNRKRVKKLKEENPEEFYKKTRVMNDRWRENNPEKVAWKSIKSSAKMRKIKLEISFNEFLQLFWGKLCFYCNNNKMTGLDRIDSNKGYTLDNVVPACGTCNKMKQSMTIKEFINRLENIIKRKNIILLKP